MLHVALLRSPHAHARIRRSTSHAPRASRGPRRVSHADLGPAGRGDPHGAAAGELGGQNFAISRGPRAVRGRARGRRRRGEPGRAEDACELVDVDYEVLPSAQIAATGTPAVHDGAPDNVGAAQPPAR